jgi:hypothetical protein
LNIKLSVKQRADTVGTLRFVSVFLMETLARWIPTTPEMEVKMLFSRQVWRMAQQADRLGRRARELRAPLHYSRPPRPEFLAALKQLAAVSDTVDRIDAFHGVALPALVDAYRRYLAETDRLTDEPTVMICDQALGELEAIQRDRVEWGSEIPPSRPQDSEALKSVRRAFATAKDMVDETDQPALAGA